MFHGRQNFGITMFIMQEVLDSSISSKLIFLEVQ